ncbi:C40 family peptidase [uncultured Capnocytophaga sp.]|mgnify:CR=1 FL=1|uniref:C40 family peptidase n=1 Tax=uncultured Capnocytophaga sp. TaxID=159273 RepID=UPI002614BDB5|nr:C40 family peptidase [uncultured Capnocytophaga sp.]
MKKIFPTLTLAFLAGLSLQAQNRPARQLVDNPSYMEGANDMLIAATDFGNISRYEREVIDESNMPISRKAELLIKPNLAALGAEERIVTLIDSAFSYIGTPYKWAGTSRSGMDCSGFVSTAFSAINVPLSRSSTEMSTQGTDIPLSQAEVGDLLFFKTTRKRNRISHVGIVVGVGEEVKFIHASVSQGITVSSLSEDYWQKAYAKTSRVLK